MDSVGVTIRVVVAVMLVVGVMAYFIGVHYRKRREELDSIRSKEAELLAENRMIDRLSRMRTEFFQSMSHDLKTPLTVISTCLLNAADVLDFDEEINRDELRESLGYAQLEIIRMARMVDSALKLTSMHDGRKNLKSMDLEKFLRDSAEIYRILLERYNNVLTVNIHQPLPHILGNTDMLLHVLSNLLSNSNRYTRGGEINISAQNRGGSVAVTVRDTGSGVNPEILPRIFERGVSDTGTGLGLSICKTIIEEVHDGSISVQSEIGKGTAITFTLPVYEAEWGVGSDGKGS